MLHGLPAKLRCLEEVFSKTKTVALDGHIRGNLGPYEVCVYHYRQGG